MARGCVGLSVTRVGTDFVECGGNLWLQHELCLDPSCLQLHSEFIYFEVVQ